MPTNPYFPQGEAAEKDLYEDLVIEALKIYGQDVYYVPRNIVSQDAILNEDIESTFDEAYLMEMYIETLDSFTGDGDILGKFGLEIRDQATLVVAKKTFLKETAGSSPELPHPTEGDLIFLPLTGALFEISFVEHEQPFYQLNNLPIYKLTVEKFEYRGQEIDTGIEEIDQVQIDQTPGGTSIVYTMDVFGQNYAVGDTLSVTPMNGAWTVTAEVLEIFTAFRYDPDINDDEGTYVDIIRIGQYSSTDGIVHILEGDVDLLNQLGYSGQGEIIDSLEEGEYNFDIIDDSDEFEQAAADLIDTSESNPFGDPNA